MPIKNFSEMKLAATKIKALGAKNVLVKGGHLNFSDGKIHSVLLDEKNNFHRISNQRVGNKKLHGTGCTLASAIACNVAKKMELITAVRKANAYVYRAIAKNLTVGSGAKVLQHWC